MTDKNENLNNVFYRNGTRYGANDDKTFYNKYMYIAKFAQIEVTVQPSIMSRKPIPHGKLFRALKK